MGDPIYDQNLRLSQAEYRLGRTGLHSRPRCLGIVLGNRCNLRCVHCYQPRNGDNLLEPAGTGSSLRREFAGFYPYLSSLRVLGGEVLAMAEFRDVLEDVATTVRRPIVSISTNGTLIDEAWAETMARTPFSSVTVSIDAATPETFSRLRVGARLPDVLANIRRVETWKRKLSTSLPNLDSFFVVMRSNFREIPRYLELMQEHGISSVTLQTLEINAENAARAPGLGEREVIAEPAEVAELHALLSAALPRARRVFRMVRVAGLRMLFEQHGLDGAFLMEDTQGLYPESDPLRPVGATGFDLCPNPWTTLFVTENGNAHVCFLSEPVGNVHRTPLASLWNSPAAVVQRRAMVSGRYLTAGCSPLYCQWREGREFRPAALRVRAADRAAMALGHIARLYRRG